MYAASAAMLALALAGCGGGNPGGNSGGSTPPAPTPTPTPTAGRIEPLDTAKLQSSAQVKSEPVAVSRLPKEAAVPRIALGPLASAKKAAQQNTGAPLQIGQGRQVQATASAADLAGQLRWNTLADGTQVAALAFSSEGAQAMRLGVLARRVPAGAVLRFYGENGANMVEKTAAELDELRQLNEAGGVAGDDARMVWGPVTTGSVSVLEVQLPAGADASQLQLAVPRLSHLAQTVWQAVKSTSEIGAAGSCHLDVMCNADLQAESRSVAKMVFTLASGDSTYCTGTLMNDAKGSLTPYFLTANHCMSTQAAASTIVTYWYFRAASCGSSPDYDPAAAYLDGGATLLFTDKTSDGTLLKLNKNIPASAGLVYAGSYYGAVQAQGTSVAGVHHPEGDLQKYSLGSVTGYATCTVNLEAYRIDCPLGTASSSAAYRIVFTKGIVEGGSSGSGIFVKQGDTRYLVGTLTGGGSSCKTPNGDEFYGRFDYMYNRGMKAYLNP